MSAFSFITSSLGKKYIMATTGLVLVLFVLGHMAGNLQIFGDPYLINAYAKKLKDLGPFLWIIRLVLLAVVVAHFWTGITLAIQNRKARPNRYEAEDTVQASLASRTMAISGLIVLAFILFHIFHFTVQNVPGHGYREAIQMPNGDLYAAYAPLAKPDGTVVQANGKDVMVHDVHTMMVAGFSYWYISLFYIVGIGLLFMHISHGISSMFQSVGLRNSYWRSILQPSAVVVAIIVAGGFICIPLAVLFGIVEPQGIPLADIEAATDHALNAAH